MATYSEVLAKIAILGFTYLKTVTYNGVSYACYYNSSPSVKFYIGTNYTSGCTGSATTYNQIVDYNFRYMGVTKLDSGQNSQYGGQCVFGYLKHYRYCSNVNLWLPSKELASQITGVTWQGWTCSESSTSLAYRSSSGTNSTATKTTSYSGMLVVVNLDDAYLIKAGRIKIGNYKLYCENGNIVIATGNY